ncbi:nucleotidyltransferase-like protein [Alteribacter populi]|uniref:nucleotidyltransferase-like protein n=1 Tax=Alteribacter populi TaxID=2011011 RepID=UPI000BBAB179|nr:nucleotidyltransferase-like protein [Alteribacter populi]
MDDFLRQLYQDRTSDLHTLGVMMIESKDSKDAITDYFDVVLLVIVSENKPLWETKHYTYDGYKVAMHLVHTEQLNIWLINSSNRRVFDWVMNGKVLFDRNEFVKEFREQMFDFPMEERKLRIGVEFAKLIRRFTDGKALFHEGHYLDSYNQILHALHNLARLSVIEHGFYPEVTVWQQVKQIEPEIHKLYSELVTGEESIEKKLDLLLIANEFELTSKTRLGSAHLLDLMASKDEPWSIEELKTSMEVSEYSLDLTILLEFLVQKGYVDIIRMKTRGNSIYHRYYQVGDSLS